MDCYIGVDVGTGSARAGVFTLEGGMLGSSARPIQTWRPQADFVEQSSEDIWQACVTCVREAVKASAIAPSQVKGIGFDATCSLVVLDADGQPLTVSPTGAHAQNVVVWMDHRATAEAQEINGHGHEVLKYIGGTMSPEMETPKLLWLKRHMPDTWRRMGRALDLPDFLTYRATACDVRSLCSAVCKWTYLGHEGSDDTASVGAWDRSYFAAVGLEDLLENGARKIGHCMRPLGEPVGTGLTEEVAAALGLPPGTPVSTSVIDAHAGGIGVLGAGARDEGLWARRVALIGGTSSCHMAVSPAPAFIPGVWGPYFSAMVPGLWLNEGGQSATGALLDHVIDTHAAAATLRSKAEAQGQTVYAVLNAAVEELAARASLAHAALLTAHLHVLPYFHGNRSPRADPLLTGVVVGLRMRSSVEELALLYLATIQAIALGTRHIIETMNDKSYKIDTIMACGGGTKNPVWMQEHANATSCTVVLPQEPEAVLLGGAILGAVAGKAYGSVPEGMAAMSKAGVCVAPEASLRDFYARKYAVFLEMYNDHQKYKRLMQP